MAVALADFSRSIDHSQGTCEWGDSISELGFTKAYSPVSCMVFILRDANGWSDSMPHSITCKAVKIEHVYLQRQSIMTWVLVSAIETSDCGVVWPTRFLEI